MKKVRISCVDFSEATDFFKRPEMQGAQNRRKFAGQVDKNRSQAVLVQKLKLMKSAKFRVLDARHSQQADAPLI